MKNPRFEHQAAQGRTRSLALVLLAVLAILSPASLTHAAGPRKPAPVHVDPARAAAMRASFDSTVVDTHPSPEAVRVLQTIPDPLAAGAKVPPPAIVVPVHADSLAPGSPAGSIATPADSTGSDVDSTETPPAPERGQVLGDFSLPVALPDSLLAPMFPPGEHPTVPTGGFGAVGIPTSPDSCWGIQVAAPTEADRAEAIRSAAQSLLLIPMKIDAAGGRFRVQTRDCMSAEVAEKLRRRAIDTGFADTFRTVGGNAGKEAPTTGGAGKKPKKR
jgi:hypothetical protein